MENDINDFDVVGAENQCFLFAVGMLEAYGNASGFAFPTGTATYLRADKVAHITDTFRQAAKHLQEMLPIPADVFNFSNVIERVCRPLGTWCGEYDREDGFPPVPAVLYRVQDYFDELAQKCATPITGDFNCILPIDVWIQAATYADAASCALEMLVAGRASAARYGCSHYWVMSNREPQRHDGCWTVTVLAEGKGPGLETAHSRLRGLFVEMFGPICLGWEPTMACGQILHEVQFADGDLPGLPVLCGPDALQGVEAGLVPAAFR